jgi:hypothetical protein
VGVGDDLGAMGRPADMLLGVRAGARMALFPAGLSRDVGLPADGHGPVRCRIGGLPTVLVEVRDGLFLDLAGLARGWPRWVAELVARFGEAEARALLAGALVLEPTERLTDVILEHQVHARDLALLGEPGAQTKAPEAAFETSLALPRGVLTVRADAAAFDAALAGSLDPSGVAITWQGVPIALPRTSELPWTERDLAELAVVVGTSLGAPSDALAIVEAALPDGPPDAPDSLARAVLLNAWGVALRRAGRLADAVSMLERARDIGARVDPKAEQEATYNLGYAKLETTMAHRTPSGGPGVHAVSATYDLDERHRATWRACLALFERAVELDPKDEVARGQVRQVETLLAALDVGKGGAPPPLSPALRKPPTGAEAPARKTKKQAEGLPVWVMPAVISVAITIVFAVMVLSAARTPPRRRPSVQSEASAPREPSARERSETARREVLAGDLAALPAPTDAPCPIRVRAATPVEHGEVVAPHLGRAVGSGELYGTEYFDGTIRQWAALHAPALDVRPYSAGPIGPLAGGEAPPSWLPRLDDYAVTMLVRAFVDPIVTPGADSLVPGHIEARLVVWSDAAMRFVCTAEVAADNAPTLEIATSPDLTQPEDDPLNRARLDLIEQAFARGITQLVATADDVDAGTEPSASPSAPVP